MKILTEIFYQKVIVSNVISAFLDHVEPKFFLPADHSGPLFKTSLSAPVAYAYFVSEREEAALGRCPFFQMFFKISVLKNSGIFTGKHLFRGLLLTNFCFSNRFFIHKNYVQNIHCLALMYGAPFGQKLITFMHINFNFCTTSKYFLCDENFFNQYNIYLYNMNFFCQHVFLFCATLNIFSKHESLFFGVR